MAKKRKPTESTALPLDEIRAALLEWKHPKNADRAPVDYLIELDEKFGKPLAPSLAKLAGYDPLERVHEAALLMLFVAGADRTLQPPIRKRVLAGAKDALLASFKDPEVTDDRKFAIGPIVELLGVKLPREEYEACFKDFAAVNERKTRERMTALPDTIEALEGPLETLGLVGEVFAPKASRREALDEGFQIALGIARHNPNIGGSLLCIIAAIAEEEGLEHDSALHALDLAFELRSPRALWFLEELGRWPLTGELGERARQHATELAGVGIAGKPPHSGELSHGLVSCVDGSGSRSVNLFAKSGEGSLHAVSFLLSDQEGVVDVWCGFDKGAEIEEHLRQGPMPMAPCDLALARDLVGDALVLHTQRNRKVPGRLLLYRPFLGEAAIPVAPRRVDLGVYLLETIVPAPEMVSGSEELAEQSPYHTLWCATDAAFEFVRDKLSKKRGKISNAVVTDFAREVASQQRELLASRLAANLEIEARAGRAQRSVNRIAARTLVALRENIVPFHEIPYVVALSRRAVEAIRQHVRDGLRSPADVEKAHLLELERMRNLGE